MWNSNFVISAFTWCLLFFLDPFALNPTCIRCFSPVTWSTSTFSCSSSSSTSSSTSSSITSSTCWPSFWTTSETVSSMLSTSLSETWACLLRREEVDGDLVISGELSRRRLEAGGGGASGHWGTIAAVVVVHSSSESGGLWGWRTTRRGSSFPGLNFRNSGGGSNHRSASRGLQLWWSCSRTFAKNSDNSSRRIVIAKCVRIVARFVLMSGPHSEFRFRGFLSMGRFGSQVVPGSFFGYRPAERW